MVFYTVSARRTSTHPASVAAAHRPQRSKHLCQTKVALAASLCSDANLLCRTAVTVKYSNVRLFIYCQVCTTDQARQAVYNFSASLYASGRHVEQRQHACFAPGCRSG
jgi:hypothetical protein